ncbi:nucleotidyltransferase family protein [Xanthomarina sp. F1114]|uniref:nucleotidyltransferase family protein n=1 Tax=Xanthomarina sp. F1114 TaxID=2996019 RepID=UPI00225DFA5F|nr:nucleotidyltransferase family protein [Xanthomarina sp. F1114]MCX7548849.1 nucleotidyltransferase family protein [Xanthomarina sp. F1114]
MTPFQAYQIIADILSFKSDSEVLKTRLAHSDFDWDALVVHASQHVVLPTLYLRLKQKSLLSVLPADLRDYLEELTDINRNRNISLLRDVHTISKLFQNHDIEHVFLKGTGLLAAGYYIDLGERMIGDIDILVSEHQLEAANNVLISENYKPRKQTFGVKYFEHRHLPRLVLANSLAAVELHKSLFFKGQKALLNKECVLNSKQLINQVYVPANNHLLHHCILNWQINDRGNYYSRVSFRSIYDSLLILNKAQGVLPDELEADRFVINFLCLSTVYFKDVQHLIKDKKTFFKLSYYNFKQRHPSFSYSIDYLFRSFLFIKFLFSRLKLFLINKDYRKDVFNNYNRIFERLKGKS